MLVCKPKPKLDNLYKFKISNASLDIEINLIVASALENSCISNLFLQ